MSSSSAAATKTTKPKPKEEVGFGPKRSLPPPDPKKRTDGSGKQGPVPAVRSSTTTPKPEVKGKSEESSGSKTGTKATQKKSTTDRKTEKKVYSLPGQKYDVPEEREPLRIFYESLSKQIPSSEMAEFWMMEHGLLTADKAKKAQEKKQRRQQQLRTGTPIKHVAPMKSSVKQDRPESSRKPVGSSNGESKTKKRVTYSSGDDDDDFVVKTKKGKF